MDRAPRAGSVDPDARGGGNGWGRPGGHASGWPGIRAVQQGTVSDVCWTKHATCVVYQRPSAKPALLGPRQASEAAPPALSPSRAIGSAPAQALDVAAGGRGRLEAREPHVRGIVGSL